MGEIFGQVNPFQALKQNLGGHSFKDVSQVARVGTRRLIKIGI
jgi:hypothetical protein